MAEILLLANAQQLAELSEDLMAFLRQEHERLGLLGVKHRVLEELERGRWERTETQRKAEKLERERPETKAKDEGRLRRGIDTNEAILRMTSIPSGTACYVANEN